MSALFTASRTDDVADLIAETPLCWIVPNSQPDAAILMPLVIERDATGSLVSLLGHLPRRAPAADILQSKPAVTFLFLGPHGYISPATAGKQDWGPTWNFASAKITGSIVIDEKLTTAALTVLVDHLEGPNGWKLSELGSRYETLANQVIGFRASISSIIPRFKLGQDESDDVRNSIMTALSGTPLGTWMEHLAGDH